MTTHDNNTDHTTAPGAPPVWHVGAGKTVVNAAAAVAFLRKHAAMAVQSANDANAFGRIGSDDAEALEKPLRDYAAELSAMADAVAALDAAARAVFTAKGRYHTQVAMCDLGDLLGMETHRPTKGGA